MIGKLKGIIEHIGEDDILLDVAGVCYVVFLSSRAIANLAAIGEPATVWIETHVREDHIHLYGFTHAEDQLWFRILTKVQGVGAKMGLAILGSFTPAELQQAIAAKDAKLLTRTNGVGPKLAERLVTELKNKVGTLPVSSSAMPAHSGGPLHNNTTSATAANRSASTPQASAHDEAVSALVNLGYGRSEAFSAVTLAANQHEGEVALNELIRLGLKELAL